MERYRIESKPIEYRCHVPVIGVPNIRALRIKNRENIWVFRLQVLHRHFQLAKANISSRLVKSGVWFIRRYVFMRLVDYPLVELKLLVRELFESPRQFLKIRIQSDAE